jgi:hypothetical protein
MNIGESLFDRITNRIPAEIIPDDDPARNNLLCPDVDVPQYRRRFMTCIDKYAIEARIIASCSQNRRREGNRWPSIVPFKPPMNDSIE